jgi:hypothetical protein
MLAAASCRSSCEPDATAHTPDRHVADRQSAAPVHARPTAQRGQEGKAPVVIFPPPPQSTSASPPFFTPSLQVGAAHRPSLFPHTPELHEAPDAHLAPRPHSGHAPSQSTSDSAPLRTPSEQVGTAHTRPLPPADAAAAAAHTPLEQSAPAKHARLGGQGAQPVPAPPQSTSVSLPLRTRSLHVGAWHMRVAEEEEVLLLVDDAKAQTPDAQSPGSAHARSAAHGRQPGPPQSTSVSSPFFTPSEHVGDEQVPLSSSHTPELQSAGDAHALPTPHA